MTMHEAGHLGGYIEGGDEATIYPDLWRALVEELDVHDVIDVGCGDGVAVTFFEGLGCNVLGIDGVPQDHPSIVTHDFTKGELRPRPVSADLVWSCEFVEHVAEEYVGNFIDVFAVGKIVLMTHAAPGQPGWHHVNCQPADYWIDVMWQAGYWHDFDLTFWTRALAGKNLSPWNHYVRSGLAFRRVGE